jgi:hypothetical protein
MEGKQLKRRVCDRHAHDAQENREMNQREAVDGQEGGSCFCGS